MQENALGNLGKMTSRMLQKMLVQGQIPVSCLLRFQMVEINFLGILYFFVNLCDNP